MIVYFQDKSLIFSRVASSPGAFVLSADALREQQRAKILKIFETHNTIELLTETPEATFARFAEEFTQIEAAGGLVRHERDGAALMIYRNERWDLPKGHVEPGEELAVAALREVEEETGVQAQIGPRLCETWHAYYFPLTERWELKRTHWFRMTASEAVLMPQTEEGIAQVEWVSPEQLDERLAQSYPTIRSVFQAE